jgi:hypothetical protein
VFKWIERDDVPADILTFINDKNPDILCIQGTLHQQILIWKCIHRYILQTATKLKRVNIFLNFQLLTKEISFSKF